MKPLSLSISLFLSSILFLSTSSFADTTNTDSTDNNKNIPQSILKTIQCPDTTQSAHGVSVCIKDKKFNVFDINLFKEGSNTFSKTMEQYFSAPDKYYVSLTIEGEPTIYKKDIVISQGYWDITDITKDYSGEPGTLNLANHLNTELSNTISVNGDSDKTVMLALLIPNELKDKDTLNIVYYNSDYVSNDDFYIYCNKENQEINKSVLSCNINGNNDNELNPIMFEKKLSIPKNGKIAFQQGKLKFFIDLVKAPALEKPEQNDSLVQSLQEIHEIKSTIHNVKNIMNDDVHNNPISINTDNTKDNDEIKNGSQQNNININNTPKNDVNTGDAPNIVKNTDSTTVISNNSDQEYENEKKLFEKNKEELNKKLKEVNATLQDVKSLRAKLKQDLSSLQSLQKQE